MNAPESVQLNTTFTLSMPYRAGPNAFGAMMALLMEVEGTLARVRITLLGSTTPPASIAALADGLGLLVLLGERRLR